MPGPYVTTESQIFPLSARPNSVNEHYIHLWPLGVENSKNLFQPKYDEIDVILFKCFVCLL